MRAISLVAVLLCAMLPEIGKAELVIETGEHFIVRGRTKDIPIYAYGSGEEVEGLNLYVQIQEGGSAPPVITGIDVDSPGTLFHGNSFGLFSDHSDPRTWMANVLTETGTLPVTSHVLGYVTVDATGAAPLQSFTLRLKDVVPYPEDPTFILSSDFAGLDTTVNDGVIWIVIPGDANLDGQVNDLDASVLAINWLNQSGTATWRMGDFNGDGNVSCIDASILAANWGHIEPGEGSVPEPSVLGLLGTAILSGVAFRRRRKRES